MYSLWNPWHGCHKCSEGCYHYYIHKGDAKRKIDTNIISKSKDFYKPRETYKNGNPKIKPGLVYLCFDSDFLIEEADEWRVECFKMIKEHPDSMFLFLTKRIDRFMKIIPKDWKDGYDNVTVACTIENQKNADYRLSIFKDLPIKHKIITAQPLLENIDIEKYLEGIEDVIVGGESDKNARLFDFNWALNLKDQCVRKNVSFTFRQCGTYTMKDKRIYTIPTRQLMSQAKKANIDYDVKTIHK